MFSVSKTATNSSVTDSYIIDIILDKQIYNPGDTIRGEAILRLNKNLFCDLITVQLFGSVRVFWTDKQVRDGSFHTVAHEQKRVLLSETVTLWQEANKYRKEPAALTLDDVLRLSSSTAIHSRKIDNGQQISGLPPGDHKFDFTFQLPKSGLYTSFDLRDCCGRIQYHLNVQCFAHSHLLTRKKLVFPIVCPFNISDRLLSPVAKSARRKIEFKNEQFLEIELITSKRYLCPGEAIQAQIFIDNRSGKSVKYSHLSIQQHVFCIAEYPFTCDKEWFQDTSGVGLNVHKVPSGSIHKYVSKFNVPALIPGFTIDGCLTLDYALKLDIAFKRCSKISDMKDIVCSLLIPIFIGTSTMIQKQTDEETALPPSYREIEPPPPYAICVSEQHEFE